MRATPSLCTHGKVPREHEACKHHEVQPREGLGRALGVLRKAAEARHPRKAAFHDPAPGKQHEAPLRPRQFDHVQHDAVVVGVVLGLLAGLALVDIRKLDVPAVGTLHGLGRSPHLGTVLLVCQRHVQRQTMAEGVDGDGEVIPRIWA
jgi:hypothetical protein